MPDDWTFKLPWGRLYHWLPQIMPLKRRYLIWYFLYLNECINHLMNSKVKTATSMHIHNVKFVFGSNSWNLALYFDNFIKLTCGLEKAKKYLVFSLPFPIFSIEPFLFWVFFCSEYTYWPPQSVAILAGWQWNAKNLVFCMINSNLFSLKFDIINMSIKYSL